jgi:hypothetical protein
VPGATTFRRRRALPGLAGLLAGGAVVAVLARHLSAAQPIPAPVASAPVPRVPEPAADDDGDSLSVARAVTFVGGLAAAVYVLGAAATWLRFYNAHFPPDVTTNLLSHERVIATGVRGLLVGVALAVVLGLLLFYWRRREGDRQRVLSGLVPNRLMWVITALAAALSFLGAHPRPFWAYVVEGAAVALAVALLQRRHRAMCATRPEAVTTPWLEIERWLLALVLLAVCGRMSWQVFGLAAGLVVADRVGILLLRRRAKRRVLRDQMVLVLTGAALVGGLLWQVGEPPSFERVTLTPTAGTSAALRQHLPYFGESDGYVYVADLAPDGRSYSGKVVTLRRDAYTVVFESAEGSVNPNNVDTPNQWLVTWVGNYVRGEGHRIVPAAPR